jgi:hypothetical protein
VPSIALNSRLDRTVRGGAHSAYDAGAPPVRRTLSSFHWPEVRMTRRREVQSVLATAAVSGVAVWVASQLVVNLLDPMSLDGAEYKDSLVRLFLFQALVVLPIASIITGAAAAVLAPERPFRVVAIGMLPLGAFLFYCGPSSATVVSAAVYTMVAIAAAALTRVVLGLSKPVPAQQA